MKAQFKTTVAVTAIAVASVIGTSGAAKAQGAPTFGQHQPPQAKATVRDILEHPEFQSDPVVQEQIDQLRDRLAEDALTQAEADDLFFRIINSRRTAHGD